MKSVIITDKEMLLKEFSMHSFKKEKYIGLEYEMLCLSKNDYYQLSIHDAQLLFNKFAQIVNQPNAKISSNSAFFDCFNLYLEPGGQLEISTHNFQNIFELKNQFIEIIGHLDKAAADINYKIVSLGCQPKLSLSQIPRILNLPRYNIMEQFMIENGPLGCVMMRMTCGMQVCLDFSSFSEISQMVRLCNFLTPITSAVFANSSIINGKFSQFLSYRNHVWLNTDKSRTGLVQLAFEAENVVDGFFEYALDVPLYFIIHNEKYYSADKKTFRQFMKNGIIIDKKKIYPNIDDWYIHLSTIFTDYRIRKNYFEVRNCDCCPPEYLIALAEFYRVCFYDSSLRKNLLEYFKKYTFNDIQEAQQNVPKYALKACLGKFNIKDILAEILFEILNSSQVNSQLLIPIQKISQNQKTLAQINLENLEKTYQGNIDHFLSD